jgi:predicted XRE-type DNA-binding protein
MPTTKNGIEYEVISGNIFADLGLENAEELYLYTLLGIEVVKLIDEKAYSQKEAAEILGIEPTKVVALLNAKYQHFSQERLISFPNKLDRKVTITISPHQAGEPYQEIKLVDRIPS